MGRHGTWREQDHPRRDDGKFGHGSGSHSTASRGGSAGNRRGTSDTIASADIPVRGGEVALDRHADGSLTVSNDRTSITLTKNEASDFNFLLDDIRSEETEPGSESWLKTTGPGSDGRPGRPTLAAMIRKDADNRYSLHLAENGNASVDDLRKSQGLQLNDRDIDKIVDTADDLGAASRVDTSFGPVDVYPSNNKIGIRTHAGGRPVEAELDARSFERFMQARNVVDEGFDESNKFLKGDDARNVTRVDVPTNLGKIRIERFGNPETSSPDDQWEIEPLDGSWGIMVSGREQDDLYDSLIKAGEALGLV